MSHPSPTEILTSSTIDSNGEMESEYDEYGYQKQLSRKNLHSFQVREEVKRFDSVHPSIYQIYDIIKCINAKKPDISENLGQILQQVSELEAAFVNSQEWTLCRAITEIRIVRIGLIGGNFSGRSALIHRFMTGHFRADESPEGGRYKKEISIGGRSYLVLIRDEGNCLPDTEFSLWADAVLLVYSVDSLESFEQVDSYYHQIKRYRNIYDMPLALVASKDSISLSNPRQVWEYQATERATYFSKRCSYYETSSVSGCNIDRLFRDTVVKVINYHSSCMANIKASLLFDNSSAVRNGMNLSSTPNRSTLKLESLEENKTCDTSNMKFPKAISTSEHRQKKASSSAARSISSSSILTKSSNSLTRLRIGSRLGTNDDESVKVKANSTPNGFGTRSACSILDTSHSEMSLSSPSLSYNKGLHSVSTSHIQTLSTSGSASKTQGGNNRISNIIRHTLLGRMNQSNVAKRILDPGHKARQDYHVENKKPNLVGQGRAIPVKQGHLYKKPSKAMLNREWKKKYVCLYPDGRFIYYPSMKDYIENKATGKSISLAMCTVRFANRQLSKTSRSDSTVSNNPKITTEGNLDVRYHDNVAVAEVSLQLSTTPTNKIPRHRSLSRNGYNDREDELGEYFEIVSHDHTRWEFAALCTEERDEWAREIKKQIVVALKMVMNDVTRYKDSKNDVQGVTEDIQDDISKIISLQGNGKCADCDSSTDVTWVSLNLGVVLCIECAGIHRELGVHISRVRSLTLDKITKEQLSLLVTLGNIHANMVWECYAPKENKPIPTSSREKKEEWAKMKYLEKKFCTD